MTNISKRIGWIGALLTSALLLSFSFQPRAGAKSASFGTYAGGQRTEMTLIDGGVMMDGVDKSLEAIKEKYVSKAVRRMKDVPAQDIDTISIQNDRGAILLLPYAGKDIRIETVGVQDSSAYTLKTRSAEGTLHIDWSGADNQSHYFDVDQDQPVNVLRVSLPKGQKLDVTISQGSGIVSAVEPSGSVRGKTKNGSILVDAETLDAPCALTAANGKLDVVVGKVNDSLSLVVTNGGAYLSAEEAAKDVTLSASNGKVSASLNTLQDGSFTARNGQVDLSVGRIRGDVEAKVTNGKLAVALTQAPKDLRFYCDYKGIQLPDGWRDGVTFGNGKPSLRLSAASNGHAAFTVE